MPSPTDVSEVEILDHAPVALGVAHDEAPAARHHLRRHQVIARISLRWKMSVYSIDTGARSFAELKRVHPTLSDHILAARLRELRREGLICKDEPSSHRPFYTTTRRGASLLGIVRALCAWSEEEPSSPSA